MQMKRATRRLWSRGRFWLVLGFVWPLGLAAGVRAETPALVVDGAVPHRLSLSMDELKALRHERVEVSEHGTFDAVRLVTILRLAGVVLGGEPLRGPALSQALLVTAADGYAVIFALAELVPTVAHPVLLADAREGRALPASEGPLCIVAPGDMSPPRWVRRVVKLSVVTIISPRRQP